MMPVKDSVSFPFFPMEAVEADMAKGHSRFHRPAWPQRRQVEFAILSARLRRRKPEDPPLPPPFAPSPAKPRLFFPLPRPLAFEIGQKPRYLTFSRSLWRAS